MHSTASVRATVNRSEGIDGPSVGDLGCLVAGGPEQRARRLVEAVHAAQVDQLQRMPGLDGVVDLEVAEQEPQVVQVAERGQDLEHVGDRLVWRERVRLAAVAVSPRREDLLEAPPTDVLHDDVARTLVLDEVEDLDDVGVLDLGQEASLGQRRGGRVPVVCVEQALEHHPAVGDVVVRARYTQPMPPCARQPTTSYCAPPGAGRELGLERERRSALAAEARGPARRAVPAAADGLVAGRAKAPVLGHLRVGHHGIGGVARGNRRDLDQTGSEAAGLAVDLVRLVADRRAAVRDVAVGVLEIAGSRAGRRAAARWPRGAASGRRRPRAPRWRAAGAIPHRSQYPSTIWPLHPGCRQFTAKPPMTTGSR